MASRLQLWVSGWQLRISFGHSRPLDGHSGPIDIYSGPLESHSQTLDVHSCPLDGHLKLLDDQIWPLHYGRKQPRIKTEVLGHLLVRSLAPLTRLLAPDCLLHSRPPLRSLIGSLALFLARGKVNY